MVVINQLFLFYVFESDGNFIKYHNFDQSVPEKEKHKIKNNLKCIDHNILINEKFPLY